MAAQYDLTQTLLAYLDPHLGFPLLAHLSTTGLFDAHDLACAQYELAKRTDMVDYTIQLFGQAHPGQQVPEEVTKRKEAVASKGERLGHEVEKVLTVIEDPNVANALKQDKAQNLEWLQQNYNLTVEQIDALYRYGYFRFSCGNYTEAASYLYHYRVLTPENRLTASSLWGKLACDTLTGDWEHALEDVRTLREHIDAQRATTSLIVSGATDQPEAITHEAVLQRRTWLLHWCLFVFFNHPAGRVRLVELFLSPAYINTIQTSCWWLLRYLVAALVITRRQVSRGYVLEGSANPLGLAGSGSSGSSKLTPSAALRELSKVIVTEAYRLRPDPIVDFFRQLYVELDFDRAQEQLAKAEAVAQQDFFLQEHAAEFIESARFLVSEVYCRIHRNVNIADLSKRLNMSTEEGEKWIVNLICDTKTDAKIDLQEGVVRMNQQHPIVYQSVIDKTRGFTFRTSALLQAMDRRAHPAGAAADGAGRKSSRPPSKARPAEGTGAVPPASDEVPAEQ